MPCTTILVGKNATNDQSTMIARTDDGYFDEKKIIVVEPKDQPRKYVSKLNHLEIELPDNPVRYTSCPSIDDVHGVWPATGINAYNVGMTATETITSNARVLAADPLVTYKKATKEGDADIPGGISEEDIVLLVLPYIQTAKEGVLRLGALLEQYGTSESNGIAFNDEKDCWWLETIGGHHWIARRVDDDSYVVMPNQFGLDRFDFADAFGEQKNHLCSEDLREFIQENHLDLNNDGSFNPRKCFGSRTDADHCYNTPRGWFMCRYFNPTTYTWDGEHADYTPESDNIPWTLVPERKITSEDVKYILSSYYQGTEYNPYQKGNHPNKGKYRPIGISRTGVTSICQIRSDVPEAIKGIEWITFGANPWNAALPLYPNVPEMPKYVSDVSLTVSTENFYWASRLIGGLADPHFGPCIMHIERYQNTMAIEGRKLLREYDAKFVETKDLKILEEANEKLCEMAKRETDKVLFKVLRVASEHMLCGYNRSDN